MAANLWIHCNKCFARLVKPEQKFVTTSCGHMFCYKCGTRAAHAKACLVCAGALQPSSFICIGNKMTKGQAEYFMPRDDANTVNAMLTAVKINKFQHDHKNRLIEHLTDKYNHAKKEFMRLAEKYKALSEEHQRLRKRFDRPSGGHGHDFPSTSMNSSLVSSARGMSTGGQYPFNNTLNGTMDSGGRMMMGQNAVAQVTNYKRRPMRSNNSDITGNSNMSQPRSGAGVNSLSLLFQSRNRD